MTEKKGLSPWAWVAIGCGGLIVLFFIVVSMSGMFLAKKAADFVEDVQENPEAAAEMLIKMNPDLELVESDRDAGTITIREKDSGEVITVNYEDIKEGKLTFETDEGEMTFTASEDAEEGGLFTVTTGDEETLRIGTTEMDSVPEWVPVFPGATTTGTYSATTPDGLGGSFQLNSSKSAEDVLTYYVEQLEGEGWSVQKTEYSGPDGKGGQVMASMEDRTVMVILSTSEEGTQAMVNYSDSQ
jgi:uncharacterized protein YneF (UPF0154 family)